MDRRKRLLEGWQAAVDKVRAAEERTRLKSNMNNALLEKVDTVMAEVAAATMKRARK